MKLEWLHIPAEPRFGGAWMLGVVGTGLSIAHIEYRWYPKKYVISFGIHDELITKPSLAEAVAWVREMGGPDVPELGSAQA